MDKLKLKVSDMESAEELQALIDEAARSSEKHFAFQAELEWAMDVMVQTQGQIPSGFHGSQARMLRMVKDMLNRCERRKIIGSGCLTNDNVIELFLDSVDDDGDPVKSLINMDTTDVRHRAVLRHMGSVDIRKNKIVPIFPFAYGFE